MRSSLIVNHIAKYLVILILLASFIFALLWLWQRQPKIQNTQTSFQATTESKPDQPQPTSKISPADGSVLTSADITLKGKASTSNGYLAIFTNDWQTVAKTDSDGNFEKEIKLVDGLNLVELVSFSSELKKDKKNSLTYLLAKDNKNGHTIFAGPAKTIFDTLITLTITNGQKEIRASKSTIINLPKEDEEENEATGSALRSIRIGDFLIAQGNISKDQLEAKKIEVIRENLPQNTRKLTLAKTLTSPRQNLFSAKNLADNQILEFTLNKNSQISLDGKEAKSADIVKDKNTIIISHEDKDKELIDLIYLLP